MTAARQQRKRPFLMGLALFIALEVGIFAPRAINAATDGQLTVNPETGLAISGFDPVSYFTDGKAIFGRPEFELNKDGAVWRFSNEGNRGAFEQHPEVYAPQFGGYDPVAIGRDRSVRSHPLFRVVVGQRLYFFYSEQTRLAFLADPGRIIATAERKWPDVSRALGE
ncbi:MAG: YHS domain-containing (seleno)protein [Pseudolabrys sp.]